MSETIETRSRMLLGDEKIDLLKTKTVAVFGLGGVGGTAYEVLVRTGIGKIYAVDRDTVSESNLNRQMLYTADQVGAQKALCAFVRGKLIRKDIEILPENYSISEESLKEKGYDDCDYLLDCVDDIKAKVALMKFSLEKNVPLIICLGMANRINPNKIKIVGLNQTTGDPLAKALRYAAKKEGLPLSSFKCVISEEEPLVKGVTPASVMMVPSAAGLTMAYHVIKSFIE